MSEVEEKKHSTGFVVLGIVIAILGALTVIDSAYSQREDARQDTQAQADRDCLRDQIVAIADALNSRSTPVAERDDALAAWAEAVTKSQAAGASKLPRYLTEQEELENAKSNNDYPDGVCED